MPLPPFKNPKAAAARPVAAGQPLGTPSATVPPATLRTAQAEYVDDLPSFWSDVQHDGKNDALDATQTAEVPPSPAAHEALGEARASTHSATGPARARAGGKSSSAVHPHRTARACVVMALVLQATLLGAWLAAGTDGLDHAGQGLLLGLHLLSALLCLWAWRSLVRSSRKRSLNPSTSPVDVLMDTPTLKVLALSVAALGPLGVAGALIAFAFKRWFDRRGVSQDAAWLSVVGAEAPKGLNLRKSKDLSSEVEDDPMVAAALEERPMASAFADVLDHGTPAQKQDLIAAIARRFEPAFAPTLKQAFNDDDATVRMLAAAAVARLENRYTDRAIRLEQRLLAQPDNADHALALALHHDRFANSGLLDEDRVQRAREKALQMYQQSGEHRVDDPMIMLSVIRLLVRLNREDEALAMFRPLVDAKGATPALTSWFLECLYRRRRFTELRRYSALLASHEHSLEDLPEGPKDAIGWWAREAAVNPSGLVELFEELDDDNPRRPGRRTGERSRGRDGAGLPLNVPYFIPRWAQ
jgi:polysaccharide biosynthesis protein PelE